MSPNIIAASDIRQRLREVLEGLEENGQPCYITQHSRPKAVLAKYEDYEGLAQKARQAEELKTALRWSLGFIVNVTVGLELDKGPQANTSLIRAGIEEGIKRSNVPKGILTNVSEVDTLLREWDFKTFRTEQQAEVVTRTEDSVTFRHESCSPLLKTMRQNAHFLIRRVSLAPYQDLIEESSYDFLCIPCTLCRSALIHWLSDGEFLVEELHGATREPWRGICSYAVKKAPSGSRP